MFSTIYWTITYMQTVLVKVNQRRKSIGLNTLEKQTEIIRRQSKKENQSSPKDFEERKKELENWKKNTGWIK
jgi:predicted RNA-binding protein with RPS1 domain